MMVSPVSAHAAVAAACSEELDFGYAVFHSEPCELNTDTGALQMLMSVLFWYLLVWIQLQQHSPIRPLDTINQYWLWLQFQKWDGNSMPAKWTSLFTLCRAWTVSATTLWHLSFLNAVPLEKWAQSSLYPGFFMCLQGCNKLSWEDCLSFFCGWLDIYQMGPQVWSLSVAAQPSAGQQLRVLMVSLLQTGGVFLFFYFFFKLILYLVGVLVTSEWNAFNLNLILNLSVGKRHSGEK